MIQSLFSSKTLAALLAVGIAAACSPALGDEQTGGPVIVKVHELQGRLEMTVHTSRILELDKKITVTQVNDPEVLKPNVLSPNQVQISALKAGVTQVNLWDEDNRIHTVDVLVKGDAQLLREILSAQFPTSQLEAIPVGEGVLLSGFVQQPSHASLAVKVAEEFFPKVIDNVTVRGVHQVLLHVKTMEVSRTKLRQLGFNWSEIASGFQIASNPAEVVNPELAFSIINGSEYFDGFMRAMREDGLLKILAEPTLNTISGRPAVFLVGGKVPILTPQSLGTVTVSYEEYGTKVDFIPYVLDNERIRLEVRPEISEIDNQRSTSYQGWTLYAFSTRKVDTGVELKVGQTLAIAGLVQYRLESQRRGIPWLGELPYVGAAFRGVEERQNEIELLVLVTPEIVAPMEPDQVPPCGPGFGTTSPNDFELFVKGHIEVPTCQTANGCGEAGPNAVPCDDGGVRTLREVPQPCGGDGRQTGEVVGKTGSGAATAQPRTAKAPGFIGPVGYDELK